MHFHENLKYTVLKKAKCCNCREGFEFASKILNKLYLRAMTNLNLYVMILHPRVASVIPTLIILDMISLQLNLKQSHTYKQGSILICSNRVKFQIDFCINSNSCNLWAFLVNKYITFAYKIAT